MVIDSNYGSVPFRELDALRTRLLQSDIDLAICHCVTEDEIIHKAAQTDMILCTGNPPITRAVICALPALKAILRFGIGVNSIDLPAATEMGKLVLFMPGFCIEELAVHATALALTLQRNILYYDRHIRNGEWPKAKSYRPRLPKNLTLGLYGFGGSAKEMYRIFHMGFHSRVIACDPYVSGDSAKEYDVEFVNEETLLRESDILSLHIPLTQKTRHIINREAFAKMKSNATIINVARGELIDQEALADALEQGIIRFAGLDVFSEEPLPPDSRLIECENAVLTCHSAFYGTESCENQLALAYELTVSVLNGQSLPKRNIANLEGMKRNARYRFE